VSGLPLSSLCSLWRDTPLNEVAVPSVKSWVLANLLDPSDAKLDCTNMFVRQSTIADVTNRSVVWSSEDVQGGDVLIRNCRGASIYISTHCRFVVLENCQGCVVNAGVVSCRMDIINCSHNSVHVVARNLHVVDSSDTKIAVFSSSRPVFIGSLERNTLLPYNTYYPSLKHDLEAVNMNTSVNCWSAPLIVGRIFSQDDHSLTKSSTETKMDLLDPTTPTTPTSNPSTPSRKKKTSLRNGSASSSQGQSDESAVCLLPPDQFFPSVYPFPASCSQSDITKAIPFPYPEAYHNALLARKQRALEVRSLIDSAELDQDQRKVVHEKIQSEFNRWLEVQNLQQHLANLSSTTT